MDEREKELEAGRRRMLEMMMNGGRTYKKVKRKRKVTKPLPQVGQAQKGTIFNYLSNKIIGGKMMKTLGRKRNGEDLCDDMVVDQRTRKRSKYSVDPNSNDGGGGPNSLPDTEPEIIDVKE